MLRLTLQYLVTWRAWARSEKGTSVIEYALLVALIAVVALGAVTYFQVETTGKLSSASSEIVNAG